MKAIAILLSLLLAVHPCNAMLLWSQTATGTASSDNSTYNYWIEN